MRFELTRRAAVRFTLWTACGFLSRSAMFAASDFWNRKQPSEWTEEEVHRLMSKSPWAKEVNAGAQPDRRGLTGAPPAPDVSGGGPGRGMTGVPGGYDIGYGEERRQRGARPATAVTVRWESAQPILEATKEKLPAEFNGHYVLAVVGLPLEWGLDRPSRADRNRAEDQAIRLSDVLERLK